MQDKVISLGQYFTDKDMARFMLRLVFPCDKQFSFLEPSCGEGVFLRHLLDEGYSDVTGYEVDESLKADVPREIIIYRSFISENISRKFDVGIGNPPYVRWRHLPKTTKEELTKSKLWNKYCNALCDLLYFFIIKSVELLEDDGQLVFITPSYWFYTTHGLRLRNYLVEKGSFEAIYLFNEAPIFKKVSSSIAVFKYMKGKIRNNISIAEYNSRNPVDAIILDAISKKQLTNDVLYYSIPAFEKNKPWVLAPHQIRKAIDIYEGKCTSRIGDLCDVCNGMVTGLDKAFQIPKNTHLTEFEKQCTLKIMKARNLEPFVYKDTINYIFAQDVESEDEFRERCPTFASLLAPFEVDLHKRYSYNRKVPYWHWVFLRNYETLRKSVARIFVPCKERISKKTSFTFVLMPPKIYPTQDVTAILLKPNIIFREGLWYLVSLLNSRQVFNWVRYKGIIKGKVVEFSEAPINKIPIKRINWNDEREMVIYKSMKSAYNEAEWQQLQFLIDDLLKT
jgi:adenine-specific DNA-methyltransferase